MRSRRQKISQGSKLAFGGEPQRSKRARGTGARPLAILLAATMLAGCASLPSLQADNHLARVEILALLQTLNADLLSHDSATQTLELWCADHGLANPARIVAQRVRDTDKPIPADLRSRLAASADETIGYRHVRLLCGDHVLSEADNWYLPRRLTDEMNRQLDATDEPFGKVVRPLDFRRRTLAAELLWSPLPRGWEMKTTPDRLAGERAPAQIPEAVLRHTAILYGADQRPFSAVVETYTGQVFDFLKTGSSVGTR
jgi:chorismate-pyruvate lyase